MTGFEPQTSGVGNDPSTNRAVRYDPLVDLPQVGLLITLFNFVLVVIRHLNKNEQNQSVSITINFCLGMTIRMNFFCIETNRIRVKYFLRWLKCIRGCKRETNFILGGGQIWIS